MFDDIRLHTLIGGAPSTREQLRARYERQSAGQSPDGAQGWLNWMARRTIDGRLVGTVQATLSRPSAECREAAVAWVIGTAYQGHGYGREAALAMARWLREQRVGRLVAHIHPANDPSAGIARALGLRPTEVVVDGEARWSDDGA